MTLGRPAVDEVHLWWVALDRDDPGVQVLDDAERSRVERVRREADRTRLIARRVALRELLGAYLGVAPADVPIVEGRDGKPACPGSDLDFSTSHSGPWGAVAVSSGPPVGVDVEFRADGAWEPFPVDLFLSASEQARLPESGRLRRVAELWVMKEALAKAIGTGLDPGPAEMELVDEGHDVAVRLHGPWAPRASGRWHVRLVDSDGARICAVAVEGTWRRTSSRRWPED